MYKFPPCWDFIGIYNPPLMVRFKKKQQEFSEGYVMPKMTGTADAWMVANVDGWMNERTENQIPISHHA